MGYRVNDSVEDGSTLEAEARPGVAARIADLRRRLAGLGGDVEVTSEGTALACRDDGGEAVLPSSIEGPDKEWRAVPRSVVGARDSSVSDAIASLREQLAHGDVRVNSDGTVEGLGAAARSDGARGGQPSSLDSGGEYKPVPRSVVGAAQWYEADPALQAAEVRAMRDIKPDARWGYLPNGNMYWQLGIDPVNVLGQRRHWAFLAVYDPDHPQKRWGGSVKYYPVRPNYQEMCEMVGRSHVTPKHVPHTLRDDDGQIYLCTQDRSLIEADRGPGGRVTTAATGLRFAMRWVNVFELGLLDQKTWSMFQREGEI